MKSWRLISLALPILLLAAGPASANANLVSSELVNRGEGYVFKSREFGELRITKLSVGRDRNPKCMLDLSSVEEQISNNIKSNTLNIRPMPNNPNGAILILLLKYQTVGSTGMCYGNGSECEITIAVPDGIRNIRLK